MRRFLIRRPLLVIVAWSALVGAGFAVGGGVFARLVPDAGTVPGSESDRTRQALDAARPHPPTLSAVISTTPADRAATFSSVEDAVADLRRLPGVAEVADPVTSTATGPTGPAILVRVTLRPDGPTAGVAADQSADDVAARLSQVRPGQVTVAGGPLTEHEFDHQAQSDVQRAELVSLPVVLVLLLLVFGGLVAAGLPLLVAVVGIGTTFGILYGFSLVSDVSVYAIQVVTMLSVGLAVDYALLVVSRFREERRAAPDVPQAVARTLASAGRTVLFSGLTVAASLAGLLVFPDPFLRSLGFAGAAVVLMDVLAALTLLPALLVLLGHRVAARDRRHRPAGHTYRGGVFARLAKAVQRRPLLTILATAGALVVLAVPALDLRLSTGDPRMLPTSTQTRQLYDALDTYFPEHHTPNPIVVVAGSPPGSAAVGEFGDRIAALPGITGVEVEPVAPNRTALRATPDQPGSAAVGTVRRIRDLPAPFPVAVTGDAARLADYQSMLGQRLPWAAGVVVLATLLLLFIFTGSVLLPVKAVLTNVLSIGAALGVVVWGFQQGNLAGLFGTVPLDTSLTVPVLVAAIAFGLAMDYEMFLLARIRERHLAGLPSDQAVADGLQRGGRIVTSAALLLVVVFAGFLVGGFAPIKQIGLGLALAVALDATVVRMLLVPATMTVLGRYNWWAPGPLRRLHRRIGLAEPPAVAAVRAAPAVSARV